MLRWKKRERERERERVREWERERDYWDRYGGHLASLQATDLLADCSPIDFANWPPGWPLSLYIFWRPTHYISGAIHVIPFRCFIFTLIHSSTIMCWNQQPTWPVKGQYVTISPSSKLTICHTDFCLI